jgi:hypothetical protein
MRFKLYSLGLLVLLLLLVFFLFFSFEKRKREPLPVEAPRSSESLKKAEELLEALVRGVKEKNVRLLLKISSSELKKEKGGKVGLENEWKKCSVFLNEIEGRWKIVKFKDYGNVAITEISVESEEKERSAFFLFRKENSRWKVRDFWYLQDGGNSLN